MAERNPFELAEKIFLYRTGELDQTEREKLERQIADDPALKSLVDELDSPELVQRGLARLAMFDTKAAYSQALDTVYPTKRLSRRHYVLVAASVAVMIAFGLLLRFLSSSQADPEVILTRQDSVAGVQLMLASGERVVTDTLSFLRANEVDFTEEDGMLIVRTLETTPSPEMHKIIVPYKQKYQIVLPDGSKVFLNAGSTLTFPSSFQGDQRRVKLEGEAFFEIAHSKDKQFVVETAQQQIRVLGTVFNVKAYTNEPVHYTTLMEGRIALRSQGTQEELVLTPGKQVQYNLEGRRAVVVSADPVIAANWKDGWLAFDNMPMDEILRQIGRWYNLEVVLADPSLHKVSASGKILLYPDVNDVLRKFEKLDDIHFEMSDNRIVAKHMNTIKKQ